MREYFLSCARFHLLDGPRARKDNRVCQPRLLPAVLGHLRLNPVRARQRPHWIDLTLSVHDALQNRSDCHGAPILLLPFTHHFASLNRTRFASPETRRRGVLYAVVKDPKEATLSRNAENGFRTCFSLRHHKPGDAGRGAQMRNISHDQSLTIVFFTSCYIECFSYK